MANLEIEIGAVTTGLDKGLSAAEKKLQAFSKNAISAGKKLSLVVTAPLAGLAGLGLLNFDKQAQAIGQVETALLSTGNAAGKSSQELQKTASALQNISTFGDEDILQKVTSQLLTFTNIANEQFDKTQKAALDLATRLGGDLQGATIQLGKALNDPVANLSALSRSGIQFSEAQKTLINSLVETNRLADAQDIILAELEKQYGGSAEAAAKLGLGPLKQLSNQFGDLTEDIGSIIAEALTPLISAASKVISFFQNLSKETKTVIVVIGALAAAIGPVLLAVGSLGLALPAITAGLASVKVALAALTGPIGLAVAAVVLLGVTIFKNWDQIKEVLKNAGIIQLLNDLKSAFTEAVSSIGTALGELFNVVKFVAGAIINGLKPVIDFFVSIFVSRIKSAIEVLTNIFAGIRNLIEGDFSIAFERLKIIFLNISKVIIESLSVLTQFIPGIGDKVNGVLVGIDKKLAETRGNIGMLEGRKAFEELGRSATEAGEKVATGLGGGLDEVTSKAKLTLEQFSKLADIANENVFAKFAADADLFNSKLEENLSLQARIAASVGNINTSQNIPNIQIDDPGIPIRETADELIAQTDRVKFSVEDMSSIVRTGFNEIGSIITSGLGGASAGLSKFISSLTSFAGEVVTRMLAVSKANAIAGATAAGTATGPAAPFVTPGLIAGALGVVAAAFSAIKGGGGASGGGTSGVGQSFSGSGANTAFVDSFGAMEIVGTSTVKGEDIIISYEKAKRKNGR